MAKYALLEVMAYRLSLLHYDWEPDVAFLFGLT